MAKKTWEENISELTKRISEGGWSSLYSFVEQHATEDDFYWEDDDEDDE